eukprot:13856682-Heterocapsa_arctica.AAC.1
MLTGLLSPVWDPTVDWIDQWHAWEHAVAQYEDASGSRLSDGVKYAPLASTALADARARRCYA